MKRDGLMRIDLIRYDALINNPDFNSWGEIWTIESYCDGDLIVRILQCPF
jgi:hypothetical protein